MNRMEIDESIRELECGINALGAIHDAMECGSFPAELHLDGLYFVYSHLFEAVEALRREADKKDE